MSVDVERVIAGYREAMEFTDCARGDELEGKEFSDALVTKLRLDCLAFLSACAEYEPGLVDKVAEYAPDYEDEQMGRDFWLTRNGHGAGFWDRKQLDVTPNGDKQTLGDALTSVAQRFPECGLYEGDDGLVYC